MSVEAEKQLLALLYDLPEMWPEVAKLEEEDFRDPYRAVFSSMRSTIVAQERPTMVRVAEDTGLTLDSVKAILSTDYDPSRVSYYVNTLTAMTDKRNLQAVKQADTLEKAKAALDIALESRLRVQHTDEWEIENLIAQHLATVEYERNIPLNRRVIRSPWASLDRIMSFDRGDSIVFGGRPGTGKSSALGQIMEHALRSGFVVDHYDFEMGRGGVIDRMVARNTGLSIRGIADRELSDAQWGMYYDYLSKMREYKLRIIWKGAKSLSGFLDTFNALSANRKPDMITIDYLQLMNAPGERVQALGAITSALAGIAAENNIVVVYAAQISRAAEATQDKRPTNAHFRESGSIENDVAKAVLLYRPYMYFKDEDPSAAEARVSKNRKGPTDDVKLRWDGARMAYYDYDADTLF